MNSIDSGERESTKKCLSRKERNDSCGWMVSSKVAHQGGQSKERQGSSRRLEPLKAPSETDLFIPRLTYLFKIIFDFRELKLSHRGHKIRGLQPLLEETQNCRNHQKWQSRRLRQRIKTVAASIDAAWRPLDATRSRLGLDQSYSAGLIQHPGLSLSKNLTSTGPRSSWRTW